MRILIDVLHPAHVHFFRNFHREMTARGSSLCVAARAKEFSTELLERYSVPYRRISTQRSGRFGLVAELIARTLLLLRLIRDFRPTVLTGIMGPSIALAGRIMRVPAIVFYDTEFAKQTNWFVYPLAHTVITPDCYRAPVRGTHRTYPGYHELAYLHPGRFEPDPAKLRACGLRPGEPYIFVRFVSWQAAHDRCERSLTADQKRRLIKALDRHGRVLLSSEGPIPDDLKSLRITSRTEDVHHLIAHARMMVGESATMSSEAAVLGVPAVFIATTGRGYTAEQEERYGLVRHFTPEQFEGALCAIEELMGQDAGEFEAARARLLSDKIDVTDWMVTFFERNFGNGS